MKMKTFFYSLFTIVVIVLITSCAEPMPIDECVVDDPDGFFSGIIHGLICPITFIISLFSDDVAMYAVNNTGGWYDFGFLIGASIILGAGARSR